MRRIKDVDEDSFLIRRQARQSGLLPLDDDPEQDVADAAVLADDPWLDSEHVHTPEDRWSRCQVCRSLARGVY